MANEKTVMTKGGMPLVQTAPSTSIPMKGAYLYGIDLYRMRRLLHSGYCPVGHEGIPHRQVRPDAPHILEDHRPGLYNQLVLTEKLFPHLEEIDTACRERLEIIETAMMQREGVTEALKAADQMEWVRRMNSIRSRAEEIVLTELVYE